MGWLSTLLIGLGAALGGIIIAMVFLGLPVMLTIGFGWPGLLVGLAFDGIVTFAALGYLE